MERRMGREAMIFFDIETAPWGKGIAHAIDSLSPPRPPTHYKSLDKIREYVASTTRRNEAKIKDEAALSPLTGQIVAVAYKCDGSPAEALYMGLSSMGERELIQALVGQIRVHREAVSFNGMSFDVPFIRARAIKWGIDLPGEIWMQSRYRTFPHMDLRRVLSGGEAFYKGTLSAWAQMYDLGMPEPHDLNRLKEIWASGEWKELADICAKDVEVTASVYRKMEAAGLFLGRDER